MDLTIFHLQRIDFVFDMQNFTFKINRGVKYLVFKVYREGYCIHREQIVLKTWIAQKYRHSFVINLEQKTYECTIIFGKTEIYSFVYSVLINNRLVAGEEPARLQEFTEEDAIEQKPLSPWQQAFYILSPVITLIIGDIIDNTIRDIFTYLKIGFIGALCMIGVEIVLNYFSKGLKFLKTILARSGKS